MRFDLLSLSATGEAGGLPRVTIAVLSVQREYEPPRAALLVALITAFDLDMPWGVGRRKLIVDLLWCHVLQVTVRPGRPAEARS